MIFGRRRAALALTLFLASPLLAVEELPTNPHPATDEAVAADYRAAEDPLASEAVEKIRATLPALRIEEDDLALPRGWPLPHTIPAVEDFFARPLEAPLASARWLDALENASGASGDLDVAAEILGGSTVSESASTAVPPLPRNCPPRLGKALRSLYQALAQAEPLVKSAADSVPPEARARFLSLYDWPDDTGVVNEEISSRRIKAAYDAMAGFRQADLLAAGRRLFRALDVFDAPALFDGVSLSAPLVWKTPLGRFVVRGRGDDHYSAADLADVVCLIDLGGKNRYAGPVGVGRDGRIRIVIDYGSDVEIDGTGETHGSAGAGIFGIGAVLFPNGAGVKTIRSTSFSQGAGLGGIGALIAHGPVHLAADRYVQGAGLFGVGLVRTDAADGSTYFASRSGQGAGFMRGVGVFLHSGSDATITGGLVEPDPREPLASVSLCQGVGFGHRAYGGGGVGLASVTGDRCRVTGSYFSQGCGYWHGLGGFRFRGNASTLQCRRYDLGSGVHSAFGTFELLGDNNRVVNWGAGPGNGWDRASAFFLLKGKSDEIAADWGAGSAEVGGRSFSYARLSSSTVKLSNYGNGTFERNEPAYSVHVLEGDGNRVKVAADLPDEGPIRLLPVPWGVMSLSGATLVNDIKTEAAVWPELPREREIKRATVDLQSELTAAASKSPLDQVADILDVAAAFSLDKQSPRQALGTLATLPPEKAAYLVDLVDPAAIDQLIQLNLCLPAHGAPIAEDILRRLDEFPTVKRAILVGFLRLSPPSAAVPDLLKRLPTATADTRLALLRTLGTVLDRDTGFEPGIRANLEAIQRSLASPKSGRRRNEARSLLERMRLGDAFGLLAMTTENRAEDRQTLLDAMQDDVNEVIASTAAVRLLDMIQRDRSANLKRVDRELAVLAAAEPRVCAAASALLTSTTTAEVDTAVVVLGEIANPVDASVVAPYIGHPRAAVRESVAAALGRMGNAGAKALKGLLGHDEPRDRAMAMVACTSGTTDRFVRILEAGMDDEDALVRMTAAASVNVLPPPLVRFRPRLLKDLRARLKREDDPEVRSAFRKLL